MSLIEKTQAAFRTHFPRTEDAIRLFRAPGRVNVIGEHTDYNDGFVLPVAINFDTVVAATPRDDRMVHVVAVDERQEDEFDLEQPITPHPSQTWSNYVRGMAKILSEADQTLSGVNLAIAGEVPRSGGLSSSASLEMALGHMFLRLSGLDVDGVKLALWGQKTENTFVGVNCGIMDQFISSLGQQDHALLIDCRDLSYESVQIPSGTAIIVVDSGIQRGLVDSEYNNRRAECETAAAHFGVTALRDLDLETLEAGKSDLDPVVYKRARHVVTEDARTMAAVKALSKGDLTALGPLMAHSHVSMRDDFEITVSGIDTLVEIMQGVEGIYGARMTGGGFGGCCIALAPQHVVPAVVEAIESRYQVETGYEPTIYQCQAAAGAGEIT
ncbi:MAG: galactokinase [Chloroflexota bacterium]